MTPSPTELLRETRWLRALARTLVEDAATADDVVQETWLAALSRNAPSSRGLLATILRRKASNTRRGSYRQRAREEAVARPERGRESTSDVVARVELQQRLVGHLLALDEPYRSVLLERYFDDLSAAEIARRRGVPAPTVRSQLARGLEQLRERLDGEQERRQWALAFVPLALPPRPASSALGASALAGAVLLVAIPGALLVANGAKPGPQTPAQAAVAQANSAIASGQGAYEVDDAIAPGAPGDAADPADPRVPVTDVAGSADASAVTDDSEAAAAYRIQGRVLDVEGRSIADVEVRAFADEDNAQGIPLRARNSDYSRRMGATRTDSEGQFEIELTAEQLYPTPEDRERGRPSVYLSVDDARYLTIYEGVDPGSEAGAFGRLPATVIVAPRAQFRGVVVDSVTRRPLSNVKIHLHEEASSDSRLLHFPEAFVPRVQPSHYAGRTNSDGEYSIDVPSYAGAELCFMRSDYATSVRVVSEGDRGPVLLEAFGPATLLSGVVRDENGAAPPRTRVYANGKSRQASPDGSWEIGLSVGHTEPTVTLAVYARTRQPIVRTVRFPLREPLVFTLAPAKTLSGRLTTYEGAPLVGWTVYATREGLSEAQRSALYNVYESKAVETGADGSFALRDLADAPHTLVAYNGMHLIRRTGVRPRSGLTLAQPAKAIRERVSGWIRTPSGEPLAGVRVRLLLETRKGTLGAHAQQTDATGWFELRDVPHGVTLHADDPRGLRVLPRSFQLPDGEAANLDLRVSARRLLRIEPGVGQAPERFYALDAEGTQLSVFSQAGRPAATPGWQLVEGRSAVVAVPGETVRLRFVTAGVERDVPVLLDAAGVTVVRW